jgi:muramoyltetrapeptide carboxypeptidase LdcA involved in peptidoglycan recycling
MGKCTAGDSCAVAENGGHNMKYPKLLKKGDTIGICAPSSGIGEDLFPRFDKAIANIKAQGYDVIESATVRNRVECASANAKTRAAELMSLYENPAIAAIIPPWGGEFLMEILPLMDFERIAALPPLQIVNGAYGKAEFAGGKAVITQEARV